MFNEIGHLYFVLLINGLIVLAINHGRGVGGRFRRRGAACNLVVATVFVAQSARHD